MIGVAYVCSSFGCFEFFRMKIMKSVCTRNNTRRQMKPNSMQMCSAVGLCRIDTNSWRYKWMSTTLLRVFSLEERRVLRLGRRRRVFFLLCLFRRRPSPHHSSSTLNVFDRLLTSLFTIYWRICYESLEPEKSSRNRRFETLSQVHGTGALFGEQNEWKSKSSKRSPPSAKRGDDETLAVDVNSNSIYDRYRASRRRRRKRWWQHLHLCY